MIKKFLIKIGLALGALAIILTPFGAFQIYAHNQKNIYTKTYYAALVDKVNYLESLKDQKKIVLIGGSNVAFGFNSKLIEKEFPEYKVVNFGLYAALGTKIMLDLAKDCIGKDDMVFIIPEINEQSMSLYFNAENTLKALEERLDLIYKLEQTNRLDVYGEYFSFVKERSKEREEVDPGQTIYRRENFNEYFDISYSASDSSGIPYRSVNRMRLHYDPTMLVNYGLSLSSEFTKYLNNYSSKIRKNGGKCFYAFSPVNIKATYSDNKTVEEDCVDFYWSLRNCLNFDVIGNPSSYIMDGHYFYDSNFHLNDAGADYRTFKFVDDVNRDIFGKAKETSFNVPEMPEYLEGEEAGEDSPTASYFMYEEYENALSISGVVDDHLNDETLELPRYFNGKHIVGISEDAFKNCTKLDNLHITNNISILMDGCFGNCSTLKHIYIDTEAPSDIIVSYTGSMTENANSDLKIYVHSPDFYSDYYWGAYSEYFELI